MHFLNSSLCLLCQDQLSKGKQEKACTDLRFLLCLALTRGLELLRPQWIGETVTQSSEEMRHKKVFVWQSVSIQESITGKMRNSQCKYSQLHSCPHTHTLTVWLHVYRAIYSNLCVCAMSDKCPCRVWTPNCTDMRGDRGNPETARGWWPTS